MQAERDTQGWIRWGFAGFIAGLSFAWLFSLEDRLWRLSIKSELFETRLLDAETKVLTIPPTPPPALLKPPIKMVLEFLQTFPRQEGQTLEQWEQGLTACKYQAQEYAIGLEDVREVMIHSSTLMLAEVADESAPWYPCGGGGHYMILTDYTFGKVFLLDTERQVTKPLSHEAFLERWAGKAVVLQPIT